MVIFGGIGLGRSFAFETYLNDVWGLDLNSGAWCKAPPEDVDIDVPQQPSPVRSTPHAHKRVQQQEEQRILSSCRQV